MIIAAVVLVGWFVLSVVVAFGVAAIIGFGQNPSAGGAQSNLGSTVSPLVVEAAHQPAAPPASADREYPLAS